MLHLHLWMILHFTSKIVQGEVGSLAKLGRPFFYGFLTFLIKMYAHSKEDKIQVVDNKFLASYSFYNCNS